MPTNVAHILPANEPDPTPLIGHHETVTPFPTEALPVWAGQMVHALARATQTDEGMGGTVALAVLAACAGGRVEIEPRPGWREPACLHTVVVARPGERKSAVHAACTRPLIDAEATLTTETADARVSAETSAKVLAGAADQARKRAETKHGTPEGAALMSEAVRAAQDAAAVVVPAMPRRVVDDATPEALTRLLAEQGGALAMMSAEGGVFDMLAGRYSKLPSLDAFLKGHAGEPLRVDRAGRAPDYVPHAALTVSVMIQPAVLDDLAANPTFAGRGLLARFLYARPTSRVGLRDVNPAPVSETARAAYAETITALMTGLQAYADEHAVLRFDPDAADHLTDLMQDIEPQLAEEGRLGAPLLAEWASKYAGAVVRVAGLLHLGEHGPRRSAAEPITADTFDRAAAIGAYYLDQAIGVFGHIDADPTTRTALYLLRRLTIEQAKTGADVVSERDMLRIARRIRTRDDLADPLLRLLDNGWLIALDDDGDQDADTKRGRPRGARYRIHPATQGDQQ